MGSEGLFSSLFSIFLIFSPKPNTKKCHFSPHFSLPIFHLSCVHINQTYSQIFPSCYLYQRQLILQQFPSGTPFANTKLNDILTTAHLFQLTLLIATCVTSYVCIGKTSKEDYWGCFHIERVLYIEPLSSFFNHKTNPRLLSFTILYTL